MKNLNKYVQLKTKIKEGLLKKHTYIYISCPSLRILADFQVWVSITGIYWTSNNLYILPHCMASAIGFIFPVTEMNFSLLIILDSIELRKDKWWTLACSTLLPC